MQQEQLMPILAEILKHSDCIKMLDNIIATAMHSKYLHRQKLEQIRPKDTDVNLALMDLIPKHDLNDLVLDTKAKQLEHWIMGSELVDNFIGPKFYQDAAQIQEWIDTMDIPANVVDIGVADNTQEEGQYAEGSLRRQVSRNALKNFFGSNRVLNVYLSLYNETHGTNIAKIERYY